MLRAMNIASQNPALEEIVAAINNLMDIKGVSVIKDGSHAQEIMNEMHEVRMRESVQDEEQNLSEMVKEEQWLSEINSMVEYYTTNRTDEVSNPGFGINYVAADYMQDEKKGEYGFSSSFFWPNDVKVEKVPGHVLGQGVLGRAFTTLGIVQIHETLNGDAFYEVLMHEMEHMLYPNLSEQEVRLRTKYKLPFSPIFH